MSELWIDRIRTGFLSAILTLEMIGLGPAFARRPDLDPGRKRSVQAASPLELQALLKIPSTRRSSWVFSERMYKPSGAARKVPPNPATSRNSRFSTRR